MVTSNGGGGRVSQTECRTGGGIGIGNQNDIFIRRVWEEQFPQFKEEEEEDTWEEKPTKLNLKLINYPLNA